MIVFAGALWVGDRTGDPFLHLIRLSDGTLVRSVGRRGEGPGDFHDVAAFSIRPGDTTGIWVFDYNQSRLSRVPAARVSGQLPRQVSGLGPTTTAGMFWLTPNRLLILGNTDSNRFMFADSTARVSSIVSGPLLGASEVPKKMREALSFASVCVRPGGDRYALAYSHASRIDLFDREGRPAGSAKVPIANINEGDVVKDPRGAWHMTSPRGYYSSCSATADRLYALFSGRMDNAGPEGSYKWDGQYIHVFDWSGTLKAVYQIDQLALAIAVSGDSVLYASGDAMNGVHRYRLPVGAHQRQ
jgi:hypothetical protein